MDNRCHAWAHLLITALKDATPEDAVGIAQGALERAVECGRREAGDLACGVDAKLLAVLLANPDIGHVREEIRAFAMDPGLPGDTRSAWATLALLLAGEGGG